MLLDDGRFLVSSNRFAKLLQSSSQEQLNKLKIVCVDSNFQVIALGLPSPRFEGNALDPPLRSRFQARDIQMRHETLFGIIAETFPNVPFETVRKLTTFADALRTVQSSGQHQLSRLLSLPETALIDMAKHLSHFPHSNLRVLLLRSFPFLLVADDVERSVVDAALEALKLSVTNEFLWSESPTSETVYRLGSSTLKKGQSTTTLHFIDELGKCTIQIHNVPCGTHMKQNSIRYQHHFVDTPLCRSILSTMTQDHAMGFDLCLIGTKGCGKTAIVSQFCQLLGYRYQTIQCYKDMTARDLLQRRSTASNGDTIWLNSPLIQAALEGDVIVLDGIHHLSMGTLSILQRLVHDREISLPDGSLLVNSAHYSRILQCNQQTNDIKSIFPVHPSFRIIALAEPPSRGSEHRWLTSEIATMFHFHIISGLSSNQKFHILTQLFPSLYKSSRPILQETSEGLKRFVTKLDYERSLKTDAADFNKGGVFVSELPELSLRQLIRLSKRLTKYPSDLLPALHNALLLKFLPTSMRQALEQIISDTIKTGDIQTKFDGRSVDCAEMKLSIECDETTVKIGYVVLTRNKPKNPALVPDVTFFEVPSHVALLQEMMKDFELGEHILLIGNQGVGKNVLADRLLQLLNVEREYIQLHRDTTVQSLTLSPTLRNGVLVWEDSPLVRAVREGRVLVVDEADKAPLEVVIVLKGLVEDGEMLLSDGRRIMKFVDNDRETLQQRRLIEPNVIPMHPDFKMIVLANRPGFPFLGNNFFRECGDCFSSHIVDNPDKESEIKLLQQYGPDVDRNTIEKLVSLFGDLRRSVENGILSYPYSLRELVNIVKHMQAFPNDSLTSVIENVFDFDNYDVHLKRHLNAVFAYHGIPLSDYTAFSVKLAEETPMQPPILTEVWNIISDSNWPIECPIICTNFEPHATWRFALQSSKRTEMLESLRVEMFTEAKVQWTVPGRGSVLGLCTTNDKQIHILTSWPLQLISYSSNWEEYITIPLSDFFHSHHMFQIVPYDENMDMSAVISTDAQKRTSYIRENGENTNRSRFEMPPNFLTAIPNRENQQNDIAIHLAMYNLLIIVNRQDSTMEPFALSSFETSSDQMFAVIGNKLFVTQHGDSAPPVRKALPRMLDYLASKNILLFVMPNIPRILVVDLNKRRTFLVSVPIPHFQLKQLNAIETNLWYLVGTDDRSFLIHWREETKFTLFPLDILQKYNVTNVTGHYWTSTNTLPNLMNNIFTFIQSAHSPIRSLLDSRSVHSVSIYSVLRGNKEFQQPLHTLYLKEPNIVVNICYMKEKDSFENSNSQAISRRQLRNTPENDEHYVIEIVDLNRTSVRYLRLFKSSSQRRRHSHTETQEFSNFVNWPAVSSLPKIVAVSELSDKELVTLQDNGVITVWEIDIYELKRSLQQWRNMGPQNTSSLKNDDIQPLTIIFEYDGHKHSTKPIQGMEDLKNESHLGGNIFAGGGGGAHTAGIGGVGGPYRLSHEQYTAQVTQAQRSNMTEEAAEAAKVMAKIALMEQLRIIEMSEFDAERYERFYRAVAFEIQQLRAVLESAQAKGKERQWMRMKTTGELDETRLVEGITGDKQIYKLREDQPPHFGTSQQKPKRLRFAMDISASMFRFNGQDKRLDRLLEVTTMIMESLIGFAHKFSYSIVGHSGDSAEVLLVDYDKPPKTAKERLCVLDKMAAHSQYCSGGDNTLLATRMAIKDVLKEDADEYFVFVFSDANFARYDVQPFEFGKVCCNVNFSFGTSRGNFLLF
jgi:MoxR-like ATPase